MNMNNNLKLGTITIHTANMDAMKRFYGETVGFAVVEAISDNRFTAFATGTGTLLSLRNIDAVYEAGDRTHNRIEIGFEAVDVDAVWQQWRDQGISVESPVTFSIGRKFIAYDPEGNLLTVYKLHGVKNNHA